MSALTSGRYHIKWTPLADLASGINGDYILVVICIV